MYLALRSIYSALCNSLVLLAIITLSCPQVFSEDANEREGRLKAACLYYLVKFIDFPSPPKDNISLCIVGDDNSVPFLEKTLSVRDIKGAKVQMNSNIRSTNDLVNCNIVYLGDVSRERASEALDVLRGKPVLTVGGVRDITDIGGTVSIMKQKNKLKIRINTGNAAKSGLKISSELLEIAELIH